MNTNDYLETINAIERGEMLGQLCPGSQIMAMRMAGYRPTQQGETPYVRMTSREIADCLADNVEISVNEVATIMLALGYSLGISDISGEEWLMSKAEQQP